jgi:uncharacterized protein YjiS (DUF1127 family)
MPTSVPVVPHHGATVGNRAGLDARLVHLLKRVELVLSVRRERRMLSALDDRELADLGLGRCDAEREAGRGLFDLPQDRLCR